MFVCAIAETPLPRAVDWILLVKERIANIGIPLDFFCVFSVLIIFDVLTFLQKF